MKKYKFYLREEDRNEEEKKTGYASYKSLVNRYIHDLVLCNNIAEIDESIWDNIQVGKLYNEENDEYIEIYQYYLCDLSKADILSLKEITNDNNDIIISYSDKLECDVLMVDHFGTSWDYVSTSLKLTDNIDDVLDL